MCSSIPGEVHFRPAPQATHRRGPYTKCTYVKLPSFVTGWVKLATMIENRGGQKRLSQTLSLRQDCIKTCWCWVGKLRRTFRPHRAQSKQSRSIPSSLHLQDMRSINLTWAEDSFVASHLFPHLYMSHLLQTLYSGVRCACWRHTRCLANVSTELPNQIQMLSSSIDDHPPAGSELPRWLPACSSCRNSFQSYVKQDEPDVCVYTIDWLKMSENCNLFLHLQAWSQVFVAGLTFCSDCHISCFIGAVLPNMCVLVLWRGYISNYGYLLFEIVHAFAPIFYIYKNIHVFLLRSLNTHFSSLAIVFYFIMYIRHKSYWKYNWLWLVKRKWKCKVMSLKEKTSCVRETSCKSSLAGFTTRS